MKVIINSPSLNPKENVSGISSVVQFVMCANDKVKHIHFEVGRKDTEDTKITTRLKRIWRNIKEYKQLLSKNKEAIVHYNIPLMRGAIIRDYMMINEAHKAGNRIILHIHGGKYLKERNRPFYIKVLLKKIFSYAQSVITLSEEEAKIISEDFGVNNIHTLPNCIDTSDAQKFNREIDTKNSLDLLFIGRIEANKGIDHIYSVAQTLKEQNINYTLHFAGKEEREGEYIPKFEAAFKEHFIYHGIVSGATKNALLRQCDIFLLPSHFEGLPISLLETMSYGAIPLVTPVGSIPTVVKDGSNGILIGRDNHKETADKIKKLSTDKEYFKQLSSSAKSTILTQFDSKIYVDKLNKIYKL